MNGLVRFTLVKLLQFLAVVFAGVSAVFFISHLSPIDPVEATIARVTSQSSFGPEAVAAMRETLTELYGTQEPLLSQYLNFWRRFLVGDFGPSLIAFPTPAMTLVKNALPWTVGLLVTATLISFLIGNLLGGLAGYFQNSRALRAFGIVAMGIQPIPYYIVAFVLLILFGFVWPVLPISGGFAMNVTPGWNWSFVSSLLAHGILPATSLAVVGFGTWFLGMRALVSNVVTEDYVTFAELGGVRRRKVVGGYVIRNAVVPQLTALAMTLGAVFSGTVITEQVFNYPGLGSLLVDAVFGGDYSLVLAVSTISVVAVAFAIFVVELAHPLLDPRVRVE